MVDLLIVGTRVAGGSAAEQLAKECGKECGGVPSGAESATTVDGSGSSTPREGGGGQWGDEPGLSDTGSADTTAVDGEVALAAIPEGGEKSPSKRAARAVSTDAAEDASPSKRKRTEPPSLTEEDSRTTAGSGGTP